MNQNQCVPNWDLDEADPTMQPPPLFKPLTSCSKSNNTLLSGHDTSISLEYEMAELTWENGHLTMLGLGQPHVTSKNTQGNAWTDKTSTRANDTLESIVKQGTNKLSSPRVPLPSGACNFSSNHAVVAKDAIVPTGSKSVGVCSTRVGSCSVSAARVPGYSDWSGSVSLSASESEQLRSMATYGVTSPSFGTSLDDTTTTTMTITIDDRDHDSVCHSMPQKEIEEEHNQTKVATKKRSRVAAIHNQSERKRRDRINERMKTLQKMVPNSNKTDKASMLDEVIEYTKQLQAQIQMFNTMRLPSMMFPLALQQQLQMSMMAPMGLMGMGSGSVTGMGMGMTMDQMNMGFNNFMGQPNLGGLSLPVMNPATYMSFPATSNAVDCVTTMSPTHPLLSAYLASQSHSAIMDTYNRLISMYQHLQQQSCQDNQGASPSVNRKLS